MGRRQKCYGLPVPIGTIAATGATTTYATVPKSGRVVACYFTGIETLAVDASNRVAFTIVNLGQAGAGTADVILATAANSTHATGGAAITANTPRALTIHTTTANLDVVEGDRLKVIATVTGTIVAETGSNVTLLINANGA